MNKNVNSTRYYSDMQEKEVAGVVEGFQTCNSGASKFTAGDVINKNASLLVECKTTMTDKESVSIKKEWIQKNKSESNALRLENSCLAFNFGPGQDSYYVIDKKLMAFLVDKLRQYYMEE